MYQKFVCLISIILVLGLSSLAFGTYYELKVPNDAKLDKDNPDTNYDDPGCIPGKDSCRYLMSWDFSGVEPVADGDGTLNIRISWKEGELSIALYELIGGAFDETTVTYNNYVGGDDITVIQGALLGSSDQSGWIAIAVPETTMQGLIDGTLDGLAMGNLPDQYMNHCIAGGEAFGIEPYLAFNAIPEPATIALLGLGGLALFRRRK